MPNNVSRTLRTTANSSQNDDSMWDAAIMDAGEEIRSLSRQLARLRQAVLIFKENKKEGMPWPIKQGASSRQDLGR